MREDRNIDLKQSCGNADIAPKYFSKMDHLTLARRSLLTNFIIFFMLLPCAIEKFIDFALINNKQQQQITVFSHQLSEKIAISALK